ncbi:MAG: hypothetical protein ABIO04_01145 [Ferruginibacter sp.]
MKKFVGIFFISFTCILTSKAQFYYRDIISNKQLLQEMSLLREKKFRTIKIRSVEQDGTESEGFFCEKKISKNYRASELFTRSDVTGASLFTSYFDEKGRLWQSRDSSALLLTVNNYSYDDQNRIKSIASSVKSSDDDFTTEIYEEHIYKHNGKDLPESMVRVKNRYDSTLILFLPDEKNNIGIEKDTKTGSKYYYYYDEKNRLLDIVHPSEYKEKLLPDYLFEYNNAGQVSQMTSTEDGGSYYYTWKYSYDNGLRTREKCYSKEKKLMGTIEYEYK